MGTIKANGLKCETSISRHHYPSIFWPKQGALAKASFGAAINCVTHSRAYGHSGNRYLYRSLVKDMFVDSSQDTHNANLQPFPVYANSTLVSPNYYKIHPSVLFNL